MYSPRVELSIIKRNSQPNVDFYLYHFANYKAHFVIGGQDLKTPQRQGVSISNLLKSH